MAGWGTAREAFAGPGAIWGQRARGWAGLVLAGALAAGMLAAVLPPVGISAAAARDGDWRPPADRVPAEGSYLYLETDPEQPADALARTTAQATFRSVWSGSVLSVRANAHDEWSVRVAGSPGERLAVGRYDVDGVVATPDVDVHTSFLALSEEPCQAMGGWFAVDHLVADDHTLSEAEVRFDVSCEDGRRHRGAWRFDATDVVATPVNPAPIPGDLWRPPDDRLPDSDTFVYLESDPEDWIAQGESYTYAPTNAVLTARVQGGDIALGLQNLFVGVNGDEGWSASFQGPDARSLPPVGFYPEARQRGHADPTRGGFTWSGEGRACGEGDGWFAVDEIEVRDGRLARISLRFEQRCADRDGALRGMVRWGTGTSAPVPANPTDEPPGTWRPDRRPGPTAVLVESEGDGILGRAGPEVFTPRNAVVTATAHPGALTVAAIGDSTWVARLRAPDGEELTTGFYGPVGGYPRDNPVRGSLRVEWRGPGSVCEGGSFAVDELVVAPDGRVQRLRLRLEQPCGDATLFGAMWFDADQADPVALNPTTPPPDLWRPAPAEVPDRPRYLLLDPDPGERLTDGTPRLYTSGDADFWVSSLTSPEGGPLSLFWRVNGGSASETWEARLTAPLDEPLVPGYYGDLIRRPHHNPLRGGLSVQSSTRTCPQSTGWYSVDQLEVDGRNVVAADVRFAHRCDGYPELRGRLRWHRDAPGTTPDPPVRDDLTGTTHEAAMRELADRRILAGYPDGTFRPCHPVTRGQMATLLHRIAELPDAPPAPFPDAAESVHAPGIAAVAAAGITSGYPDGAFRPARSITRGQFATFVQRALGLPAVEPTFADVSPTSAHAGAVGALTAAGILNGYPDGTYRPDAPVTRGQTATALTRAY